MHLLIMIKLILTVTFGITQSKTKILHSYYMFLVLNNSGKVLKKKIIKHAESFQMTSQIVLTF